MPMTIGNQPPASSFNRFDAKNVTSMTKKNRWPRGTAAAVLPAVADDEEGHHRGDGHVQRHRDAVGRRQVRR